MENSSNKYSSWDSFNYRSEDWHGTTYTHTLNRLIYFSNLCQIAVWIQSQNKRYMYEKLNISNRFVWRKQTQRLSDLTRFGRRKYWRTQLFQLGWCDVGISCRWQLSVQEALSATSPSCRTSPRRLLSRTSVLR